MLDNILLVTIVHFLLILMRISAIFLISPIFGRNNIPNIAKILLSVFITYILLPITPMNYGDVTGNLIVFAGACLTEFLIGAIMGFVITIFFAAVTFAGQIIDTQIGFSMSNVFDPQSGQVTVTSGLLNTVILLAFFAIDGHLTIIKLFSDSYYYVPIRYGVLNPDIAIYVLELFSTMLILGAKFAIPVIAAAVVSEIGFGILVRAVPQMNIFVVGMPLKIVIGMAILFLMIPVYLMMCNALFDNMFSSIEILLKGMIIGA